MPFRIIALPAQPFAPLFALDDTALAGHRARRVTADTMPGYPCRVSLVDAEPGERVILVHHEHHPVDGPFRASHAIYVRENALEARPASGMVPALFRHRILSLRGFDRDGTLRAADLAEGKALESAIEATFAVASVAYIHLHYAKAGCYAARVDRH